MRHVYIVVSWWAVSGAHRQKVFLPAEKGPGWGACAHAQSHFRQANEECSVTDIAISERGDGSLDGLTGTKEV